MPIIFTLPLRLFHAVFTIATGLFRNSIARKPMRAVIKFAGCLLLIMLSSGNQSLADEIKILYRFEHPRLIDVVHGKDAYTRVEMPNAPNGGLPGQPARPAFGAFILLPPNSGVERITVSGKNKIPLGSGYLVEPVSEQVPLSSLPAKNAFTVPDPDIYTRDVPFPSDRYEFVSVQSFRGYRMLVLKLRPAEYKPVSGELYYYDCLEVMVETGPAGRSRSMFRGRDRDRKVIEGRVDNPGQLGTYARQDKYLPENYDLLIITTPALADAFLPLKQYHDTTGIMTEIHTTTDIGSNDPDAVRDYISERYLGDGIEYVLIGGDDDIIPAKDLFVTAYNNISIADMPGDIYFACLDGTYNFDGDAYWGEINDGPGGGDVDLVADVYVGRAPVGDAIETARFVNKTIGYLTTDAPYLDKVLIAGEYVGFGDVADYAGNSLDHLIDGSEQHNFVTVGFPPADYQLDILYDRDWPTGNWPKSEIISHINNGRHIINHYGHSNVGASLKTSIADIHDSLFNDNHFFLYSQGCLAGHFDEADCWAENITVKTDHGAFAAIMNARYGYGGLNCTDGASHRYNREFWDAVFNPGEGLIELGRANHDSKEDNLYRINEGSMRWCYYELTLFGDPTVALRKVRGIAFDFPNGVPDILVPDEETVINLEIRGVGDGLPLSGSGRLHYSINGYDWHENSMIEISANVYQATLPAMACGEDIRFYFSAEEATGGRIYYPDPSRPYVATATGRFHVIFEDDLETNKGWIMAAPLWKRGIPTGAGGNYAAGPDPASGHSGNNVYGYNLEGNYEDNLTPRHLISPSLNCSGMYHTRLSFWKWLGVEAAPFDNASISVKAGDEAWVTIWQSRSEYYDVDWNLVDLDISSVADDQPVVFIRWTMGPTDGGFTYCGWNIDDIRVTGYDCLRCGDTNNDGGIDIGDAVFLIDYIFKGGAAPASLYQGDVNCSDDINVGDIVYIIYFVFSGGPEPCGACR